MEAAEENRGFRVRVAYSIIMEYRYAVYPNAKDWRVSERPKGTIFVINEDRDVKAVGGRAEIEPIKSFDPDWCIHPGAHIKEYMAVAKLSDGDAAQKIGCSVEDLKALLEGDRLIEADTAKRLESLGGTAQYWLTLEENFREGLKMGRTWAK